MSGYGIPNWPPVWVGQGIAGKEPPRGEVGILKEVRPSLALLPNRLFLIIEYNRREYMGCLFFDNREFCGQMEKLLRRLCNRTVAEIGGIDVGYTF
jgi:hypothetical protein